MKRMGGVFRAGDRIGRGFSFPFFTLLEPGVNAQSQTTRIAEGQLIGKAASFDKGRCFHAPTVSWT